MEKKEDDSELQDVLQPLKKALKATQDQKEISSSRLELPLANICVCNSSTIQSQRHQVAFLTAEALQHFKLAQQAVDSIQKKDFGIAKSFANPPKGVPQVFASAIWLLAGFNKEIQADEEGKPKQFNWKGAQKLMKDPNYFVNSLKQYYHAVDENKLKASHVAFIKENYLNMDEFNCEEMLNKSKVAAGLCEWVIHIVKYWECKTALRKLIEDRNACISCRQNEKSPEACLQNIEIVEEKGGEKAVSKKEEVYSSYRNGRQE